MHNHCYPIQPNIQSLYILLIHNTVVYDYLSDLQGYVAFLNDVVFAFTIVKFAMWAIP